MEGTGVSESPRAYRYLLHLKELHDGRTRVHEYFYYLDNDLFELFKNRPWLASVNALSNHIEEELNGLKALIESGAYDPEDFAYLWEGVTEPTRLAPNYLRPVTVAKGPRFDRKLATAKLTSPLP